MFLKSVDRRRVVVGFVAVLSACWIARPVPADQPRPHVVMLVSEPEYQTEKTLPLFAERYLSDRYRVSIVESDADDANRLQGLDAIRDADVLLVSVRRRTLPTEQLEQIRNYVAGGKPVIGIRTANHAFSIRSGQVEQGRGVWPEWDQQVFGGNYTNHYGNSLKATVTLEEEAARTSPLLEGLRETKPFLAGGSLYRVAPLAKGADVLMTGQVDGEPAEPIAWTYRRSDGGKSFYTSLGHVDDFAGDVLPQLLLNAIAWSLP